MTVADRIRLLRERKGLRQEQLASMMGYTNKSSISKIESSGDKISLKTISRIADALDTTSSYLLGWNEVKAEDNMPPVKQAEKKEPEVIYFEAHPDEEGVNYTARSNHAAMDAEYQMLNIIYNALTKENRTKIVGIMQQMLMEQKGMRNDD